MKLIYNLQFNIEMHPKWKEKDLEHMLLAIMTFKAKFGNINFFFSTG